MIPEQRRRLGHVHRRRGRHHRAQLRQLAPARLARLQMRHRRFGRGCPRPDRRVRPMSDAASQIPVAEQLLQIAERVKEIRLHRADRAAERRRRFPDATSRGTSAGSASRAASAAAARSPRGRAPRARPCSSRSAADSARVSTCCRSSIGSVARRLRADAIQADVDADPVQPRGERRLPAELPQPAVRAEEHVLRQVAGVFVVADEAVAQLIHRAAMPLDDQVERAGPAGQAGLDQRRARPDRSSD